MQSTSHTSLSAAWGRESNGVSVMTQPFPSKTQGKSSVPLQATFPLSRLCFYRAVLGKSRSSFTLDLSGCLPPPRSSQGMGGRMSFLPPPSTSHMFPGLFSSLLQMEWPPSPVFLPPIERRLKMSDVKIQLALLGEVRGRFQPESAKGCWVEQWTGSQRHLDQHSSLDTKTCMTLSKSPAWPWASHLKLSFIVWRMEAVWPALLTSPGEWQCPKKKQHKNN